MSETAIETDIIIEEEETEELEEGVEATAETPEGEAEETGEVEIIVEGEDEPTSQPGRKSGFAKRVDKLRGKVQAANDETALERQKREAAEERAKLLELKVEQLSGQSSDPPKRDDFEDAAEYDAAVLAYTNQRAEAIADQKISEALQRTQTQTTQAANDREKEGKLYAHYERVDELSIPGYEELEDSVIDVMGKELVTEIIANTKNSHLLIPHLAANLGKAEAFARLSKTNPVQCVMDIGALAGSLRIKRKPSPAADPEEDIDKGVVSDSNSVIAGARFE